VEGKNGAVIRKLIGYGHIPAEHAEALQKFYAQFLNPYLNFHRPCGFATVTVDPRGKRRRRYPVEDYQTPYERLKSLPEATRYLRPGLSWARLDPIADERSDTEWARRMQAAKNTLAPAVQVATCGAASVPLRPSRGRAVEMPGPWKAWKNQTAVSHASHRPLEISQKQRDSHISTAPTCAGWKSGKPKAGFPLFHAAQAMMMTVRVSKLKLKERKSAAVRPPHSSCSCGTSWHAGLAGRSSPEPQISCSSFD
jgi:hypothetical protein